MSTQLHKNFTDDQVKTFFRFVQGRDSFWRNHHKSTDEINPQ